MTNHRKYSSMNNRNYDLEMYFRKNYVTIKYKNKYPELFSEEFKNFCEKQVIPLYRNTKYIFMGRSATIDSKISDTYLRLFMYIILTIIPAAALSGLIKEVIPYMPFTLQNILSNKNILLLISWAIFSLGMLYCLIREFLKTRQKNKQRIIIAFYSLLIIPVSLFLYTMIKEIDVSASAVIGFFLFFIFSTPLVIHYRKKINNIKKEYKKQMLKIKKIVFPVLLSKIAKCAYITPEDKNYDMRPYLEKLSIVEKCYKKIYEANDDHFRLIYNDIKLDISEVIFPGAEIIVPDLKKEKPVYINRGGNCLFIRVKSNKPFTSKTLITRDYSLDVLNKDFQEVKTEDKDFNQAFSVESTDQVEARYLLTPTFMERLKEYAKDYPNNELNISFERGFVNIILSKGFYDLFEIESFEQRCLAAGDIAVQKMIEERESDIRTYRDILIELKESLTVIDALKLDSTIGL